MQSFDADEAPDELEEAPATSRDASRTHKLCNSYTQHSEHTYWSVLVEAEGAKALTGESYCYFGGTLSTMSIEAWC